MFLTVIPILILVGLEILCSYISMKSNKFREVLEGKPSLIINKGVLNFKELIKQRYTLHDLLLELRQNGIKNIEDVEYAVLENNGKLSIFPYKFFRINTWLPFPLILDGNIQKDTLTYLNKSDLWLRNNLKEEGVLLENVFYAFYKNNKVYIIQKKDVK